MTHIFFPEPAERPERKAEREFRARQICNVCPVKEVCLIESIDNDEYGFWGGMSEEERYLKYELNLPDISSRIRSKKQRLLKELAN